VPVLLSALPWATWGLGWLSESASEWLSVRSKRESKFAQTTKKWTAQDRAGWVYDLQIGFRIIIGVCAHHETTRLNVLES